MHSDNACTYLRALYLDMVQRCVINLIYEDPNQGFWAPRVYDAVLRRSGKDWPSQAHSMIGERRIANLRELAERVLVDQVPGDFIETGVWRGGACILLRAVLKSYGVSDRRVWVADSFCGLPKPDPRYPADELSKHYSFPELAVAIEEVKSNFTKYGLLDDRVMFLEGWFSTSLPAAPIKQLAILRLDGDLYQSTMDAFVHLYDKVSPGGYVIVDDFGIIEPCRLATLEFRKEREIRDPIHDIDGCGIFWRKTTATRV